MVKAVPGLDLAMKSVSKDTNRRPTGTRWTFNQILTVYIKRWFPFYIKCYYHSQLFALLSAARTFLILGRQSRCQRAVSDAGQIGQLTMTRPQAASPAATRPEPDPNTVQGKTEQLQTNNSWRWQKNWQDRENDENINLSVIFLSSSTEK